MRQLPRPGSSRPPTPSTRGLLVSYLLIPAVVVVLWAASEPVLAAALVAGAVGSTVLRAAYDRIDDAGVGGARRDRGERRRVCVPRIGVCVEF